MNTTELPYKLKIASPCHARWEDMGGDERVRFCSQCSKNVYNLSALNAREAAALIAEKGGNLCARMYERKDGTLLTADCPVGVRLYWSRLKALVAGGVAAILVASASAFAMTGENKSAPGEKSLAVAARGMGQRVREWLGLTQTNHPRVTMGMVCLPVKSNPTPPTQPMLGKVRVVPSQTPPPTAPAK